MRFGEFDRVLVVPNEEFLNCGAEMEVSLRERTNAKEFHYPEVNVGGFSRVDATVEFYTRVNSILTPQMEILDLGAGRGQFLEDTSNYRRSLRLLRGKVKRVVGADVDSAVLENQSVDDAVQLDTGGRLPFRDGQFSLIVSDSTFEHVQDPSTFAMEVTRVLAPGGWLCARTPNKCGYIGIGSRVVPNAFHARLLRYLQPNRKESDIFPVMYRLNTRRSICRHFPNSLFMNFSYGYNPEPAYFGDSRRMWSLVLMLQRMIPPSLSAVWMIFLRKRESVL